MVEVLITVDGVGVVFWVVMVAVVSVVGMDGEAKVVIWTLSGCWLGLEDEFSG